MIKYGLRRYGLVWHFGVWENVVVMWRGEHADWCMADRAAIDAIVERRGSFRDVNDELSKRLSDGAVCKIGLASQVSFSDIELHI